MQENGRKHRNLYYLFLWDRWNHAMPPQAKQKIADALFTQENGPERVIWREEWKEKN